MGRDDSVVIEGVPKHCIRAGSDVHEPVDRGKLVIPHWLADDLGLT